MSIKRKWKCQSLSHVLLFATPWTIAHQVPLSMEFSRQEYWRGLPFPSPGDLPHPEIKPRPPALHTGLLPSKPLDIQIMEYSNDGNWLNNQRNKLLNPQQHEFHNYVERNRPDIKKNNRWRTSETHLCWLNRIVVALRSGRPRELSVEDGNILYGVEWWCLKMAVRLCGNSFNCTIKFCASHCI